MVQKFQMTQEGLEILKKRLAELKDEQSQNIIDIQDAKSQGDLSENADYAAARKRQGEIASEINEIEVKIKNAEIIKADEDSNFSKYVTVCFIDDDNSEETYKLVGSVEADPLNGKISVESPLGSAVLKAKKGDVQLVRTESGDTFQIKVIKISEKA